MVRERMVKVMFSVLLLIGCLGWLSHGAWGATEIGTATITEDTVWGPEGSPYIVQRLSINQGVTLTLDPSTILKFRSNGFIDILGRLNINGNDQDLVILTSYYDDTAGGDTDGGTTSPNKGDWGDLNIAAGGELVCNYAKIVYGGHYSDKYRYRYNSITINNGGKAGIYDSEISNSYWVGIKNSGDLLVERTIISNGNTGLDNIKNAVIRGSKLTALDTGVKISGGQLDLTGSTIENNKVGVNYTSSATLPYIRENNFINNQTAVKNNNSNITLDCTWNYWNHEGGPSTLLNNVWTDLGDRIEGKISYEPWYTSKVTGGAEPVRIRIEGIIEGAKINTDPEIKVIVSDGVLIGTYLDGVAWSPGDAITEGAHTFKAVAENFEQQQRIVEISFSLDKTPPRAVIDNGAIIQATTSKAISISALQSTDNNNTISSYTWTFSDTEQQYNGSTIWRTFTTAGEYTVTLVVKDNHGNESEPVEARIVVGDAPVIEISGVEHGGRYNQDLEVGIAVTNGASTGITLNGNALSETSFTVSVEGYYTLVVNAQNESGITATKTVSFRLDKTPPVAKLNPERTVYADDEIILNGGLSSDISGIAEYLWSISGDSDTYEGYTVKKIFNEPGDYSVSLQVCDNCGNWSLTPSVMTLHVIEHSAEVTFNGVNDGRKYNQPVQVEIIVKYGSIKSLTLNGQECPTNFSVNDEGDYTLKVVAVGADQEEKTFIARFSIDKTPPVALIDRSVPVQGYDDNRPVAFNAGQCADNTGIVTYEWSFSDREQKYFGKSVSRVFSTSGEFIATLVVIDGYGNRSVPDYLNFEIKSKGNTAITIGGVEDNGAYTQSVPIQVTVENGTLKRIVLDDQEQTDTGFTVSGEGIHTLRVEAINESEYTTVKGIRFTIDTIPPVAMAVANRIITEGKTLTLYGSGKDHSGISEYKWIFSDGQEFFGQTFTKENLSRGEYTASLFVKDGCGNWSVEPAMVNIMVKLRPVQLEITGVKPNMYTNQDVTIGVKATYGTIASITLNGAPYAPDTVISAEGKYTLEIVAFNEAQEETRGSLVFNIDKTAPVANAGPDLKCFNDGEAVTFKGLESQDNLGVAKFEWSFSDGKKLQGPLVYKGFTQPGTYTVTLVVTDMAGNVSQPDTCQIEVTDMGNTEILVTGVEPNGRYNHDVSLQVQVLEGTLQKFQIDKEIIQASTATITCDGWRQIEIEAISPTGYVLTKRFKIGIDKTVPVADAGGDRRGYINQPVYFDGGFSSDNSGIAEFIWEFSDGATAMGRTVQHSFTQKGIYYADLKVKDGFGNWSPQSNRVQVEVRDPGELSVLRIAVKDQSQRPLVDSIIIIEDVSGKQFKQVTDDQGFATELLEPNDYKIYAYQPGYKTDTKEITVGERVNLEESFVLEQGSDVITLVESRQLDLDEIKALGIDTSLPENRFIFKFTFKVGYQELPLEYLSNGLNEISKIESEEDNTGKGWELKGFGDGEFDLFGHVSVIIRGTASVLKEFYELKMTIANGADESVSLDSILLNLDLPQGLALAPIPESRQITNGDIIRKQSCAQERHS
ncbi:MAG: PKD domain-containing protein [Firmicutes bacterium]|nr:PKD domain-containing protein [Bacillota bacterium]